MGNSSSSIDADHVESAVEEHWQPLMRKLLLLPTKETEKKTQRKQKRETKEGNK